MRAGQQAGANPEAHAGAHDGAHAGEHARGEAHLSRSRHESPVQAAPAWRGGVWRFGVCKEDQGEDSLTYCISSLARY